MLMQINKENIDHYRTGSRPHTRLIWRAGQLDADVLKTFPNLCSLVCSSNDLLTLTGLEGCPLLVELHCRGNRLISLDALRHCPLLRKLDCCANKLGSLQALEYCPQLQELLCAQNSLETLDGLEHCLQLEVMYCQNNQLTTLRAAYTLSQLRILCCFMNCLGTINVSMFPQLQQLHCAYTKLVSIEGLDSCLQLQTLNCGHNRLTSLSGIDRCLRLERLDCPDNSLTSIEQIVYLRLLELNFSYNPIEIHTPQVRRAIDRIQSVNKGSSIYADGQNVHDSHIQQTVCDSIQRLLHDPKPEFSIEMIINSSLNQHTKQQLVEYCGDETVHSHHLLSYSELLGYVWARVCRSKHKVELLRVLEEQIADAECKCFTGRFNRTLSVLVGFYPDIIISISDKSRISAIVVAIQAKLEPYDPLVHRELAQVQLLGAGYDTDEIQPWLDAIIDN